MPRAVGRIAKLRFALVVGIPPNKAGAEVIGFTVAVPCALLGITALAHVDHAPAS